MSDEDYLAARDVDALTTLALAEHGYDFVSIESQGGEFVATATKTIGATVYRAAAQGRTRQAAARSLIATITRP